MAQRNQAANGRRSRIPRILRNYRLVWVDANVEKFRDDCQHTLERLRTVVNDVEVFNEPDAGAEFIRDVVDEKVFVISSGSLGRELVPQIHSMAQVDSIYIFCGNIERNKPWTMAWPKVKDVYEQIEPICDDLRQAVQQCNQDDTPTAFAPENDTASDDDRNQLESTFMYTQVFKRIFLEMEHDEHARNNLVNFCREAKADKPGVIDEFERDYRMDNAIQWYTRQTFLYDLLNRSLRLLEADIIVNMGFYLSDLHQQIERLHREQLQQFGEQPFTVYRGQGLSKIDFEKLKSKKDGLFSFSSFLSTTKSKDAAFRFVERAAENAAKGIDSVPILFIMTIDPTINSTSFASIAGISKYENEDEVLFSMGSVFRINGVKNGNTQPQHFVVRLTLTADDDPQLRLLTVSLEKEVQGRTGWQRIGQLLISVGQLDKAEELYTALLKQPEDEIDRAHFNHQLGYILDQKGDYQRSLTYYKRTLEINRNILPENHPDLAISYNNIGLVYDNMEDYDEALRHYKEALALWKSILPPNLEGLATSYNNIASVYDSLGKYSKALSFFEKAIEIDREHLPDYHSNIGTSYHNVGLVYEKMGDHTKALQNFELALKIRKRSLPPHHPDIQSTADSIKNLT